MTASIINHELTPADEKVMETLRASFAGAPRLDFEPASRDAFDAIIGRTPAPDDVDFEARVLGAVPGWWCRPRIAGPEAAILYLHGGGYVIGSASAYRNLAGHIAARAGVPAFVADYALAPERPFPAALDDVVTMHAALPGLGYKRIALVGDSAGGGLALNAIAGDLAESDDIKGVVAISPWIDLSVSGLSMKTRAEADPLLSRETLAAAAKLFLGDKSARDERLLGLDGDLTMMPPVRIHVGDAEVLLDDSLQFARKAEKSRLDCEVHVWDGMIHVFPANVAMLEAAAAALDDIGAFLKRVLAPTP